MPRTKNNFLNAKPVSKMGGNSGGVRKPSKPYSKPSSTSGKPKLQSKLQKPTSSGKPVAPTVKGPVQRPGISGRASTVKDLLPNSAKQNTSLPKDGAAYLRGVTQGPKAPTRKPTAKPAPRPEARDVMPNSRAKKINLPSAANNAVPPKQGPTLKGTTPKNRISPNAARDSMPNSRAKGINLPKAANNAIPPNQGPSLRGVKPGLRSSATPAGPNALARNLRVGRLNAAALVLGAANVVDDTRLTPAQRAKKYEVVNPDRGQNLLNKFQSGTLGKAEPRPKLGNAQSRFAGAREANLNRINNDPRFAAPKAQPKPPAPRQTSAPSSGGNSSPSRSSGGGNAAPRSSAPRSQTPPAPRFTGTVDEGRQKWAEKYSSAKYEGQAIQKEAKKLLDEMKKRKEDKSNATKAGWDGNKNY